jgi:hypothetical protein
MKNSIFSSKPTLKPTLNREFKGVSWLAHPQLAYDLGMTCNITTELIQAFKETEYFVHAEPAFKMQIGLPCPELAQLMTEQNANCAAFITAWNPFSKQRKLEENEKRQQELKAQLKTRGLSFIDGIGQHPSNKWPGEPSFLILNLNRESAKVLAAQYEQHAFVWAAETTVPELVKTV